MTKKNAVTSTAAKKSATMLKPMLPLALPSGPTASALRARFTVATMTAAPNTWLDDMAADTSMSSSVYQGSARSRLAKMLVTFGTTTTIMTLMSPVPMTTISAG